MLIWINQPILWLHVSIFISSYQPSLGIAIALVTKHISYLILLAKHGVVVSTALGTRIWIPKSLWVILGQSIKPTYSVGGKTICASLDSLKKGQDQNWTIDQAIFLLVHPHMWNMRTLILADFAGVFCVSFTSDEVLWILKHSRVMHMWQVLLLAWRGRTWLDVLIGFCWLRMGPCFLVPSPPKSLPLFLPFKDPLTHTLPKFGKCEVFSQFFRIQSTCLISLEVEPLSGVEIHLV